MSFLRANERLSGPGSVKSLAIARLLRPIAALVGPESIPRPAFLRDAGSVEKGRVMLEAN